MKRLLTSLFALFFFFIAFHSAPADEDIDSLVIRADSLSNFAADYQTALELATLALEKATLRYGHTDTLTASIVRKLGTYNYLLGNTALAEEYFLEAIDIVQSLPSPPAELQALFESAYGNLCLRTGRFVEALERHKRALAINRTFYGENHLTTSVNNTSIAFCYLNMGEYAQAEGLYLEALATRKQTLAVFRSARDSLKSVSPLLRGLDTYEARGENGIIAYLASAYYNLAAYYLLIGDYFQARIEYQRSYELGGTVMSPGTLEMIASREGLMNSYIGLREFGLADSIGESTLSDLEEKFGEDNPRLISMLQLLGLSQEKQADWASATQYYLRALAVAQKAYGPDHPELISILNSAGVAQLRLGNLQSARTHLTRALTLCKRHLNDRNPDLAETQMNLSSYYFETQQYAKGMDLAEGAAGILGHNLWDQAALMSEADALKLRGSRRQALSHYLSCWQANLNGNTHSDTLEAANLILSSKGLVTIPALRRMRLWMADTDSTTHKLISAYQSARGEQSRLFARLSSETSSDSVLTQLDSLEAAATDLERELAGKSSVVANHIRMRNVSVDRIRDGLPDSVALVEFYKADIEDEGASGQDSRYFAVIIGSASLRAVVTLGKAEQIDSLSLRCREHLDKVSGQTFGPTIEDSQDYTQIATELYALVWRPLQRYIRQSESVIVAPDDLLHLIAFETLKSDTGTYLIEERSFSYIPTARMLLAPEHKAIKSGNLLAMGAPNFEEDSSSLQTESSLAALDEIPTRSFDPTRNVRSGCDALANGELSPLRGSAKEIRAVTSLWTSSQERDADAFVGALAGESVFKRLAPNAQYIHLATHGYFISESCNSGAGNESGNTVTAENPLLLSGLFLAGANTRFEKTAEDVGEDGVLTALEISTLDLGQTRLVTLSSCETAAGALHAGEGVYGLRRAFLLAGAQSVISALWKIPDGKTAQFMSLLYSEDLADVGLALRRVKLQRLREISASGEIDHPYSWGAFILSSTNAPGKM